MQNRILIAVALLVLMIGATACGAVEAGVSPSQDEAPAESAALSYAPKQYQDSAFASAYRSASSRADRRWRYEDSHWRLVRVASERPARAAIRYHDSNWREDRSSQLGQNYAPEQYHDSYWLPAASSPASR